MAIPIIINHRNDEETAALAAEFGVVGFYEFYGIVIRHHRALPRVLHLLSMIEPLPPSTTLEGAEVESLTGVSRVIEY